jgi:hypothetical protein
MSKAFEVGDQSGEGGIGRIEESYQIEPRILQR